MLIVLYVDDLIIMGSSYIGLRNIRYALRKSFYMRNLGLLRQFIGLEVIQKYSWIMVS